jgi:subfamily B ATP-binding cassette protein MsbA
MIALRRAFQGDPPHFSRAIEDQRRGHRTPHRILGGVRVVKGYHAEAREAEVFSGGVARLSRTCCARSPQPPP